MNDLEFVQRCIQRDSRAWEEFIDKYSRLIYNYIYCVLKQKNSSLATEDTTNDIFQELFLSLTKDNFKKLKSFEAKNKCSLASWLRQVTINYSIDYVRKIKSELSLDQEAADDVFLRDTLIDNTDSALTNLTLQEKLGYLEECIDTLDTDEKYFLELHVNKEVSLEILKHIFKISRGAIDMRKSRIIDRLRNCFRTKGFVFLKEDE